MFREKEVWDQMFQIYFVAAYGLDFLNIEYVRKWIAKATAAQSFYWNDCLALFVLKCLSIVCNWKGQSF